MRQKKWISLIVVPLLLVFATACSGIPGGAEAETTAAEKPPVPVAVAEVGTGNIASTLSYSGGLQPEESLSVLSIVAGVIEEVLVDVGDELRTGDPIIRIEDTTYRAQLKQAVAGLTVAQTNLQKMENGPREEQIEMARAGLDVANANLQKLKNGPRDEQIQIAQAAVEGAYAQRESVTNLSEDQRTLAAANLAQAEAGLRLAQYEYDKIKWAGQTGQTPQALQLQQATIAYETALAAYNLQANPDENTLTQINAGVRQAELSRDLTKNPFTAEDFTLAEAGVRQAALSLALTENPFTDEDFALARAGVEQAEAVVAMAQYQVNSAITRAPFDGIVSEVYVTTGSPASPQSPAIKLISKEMEVVLNVPENQIINLSENQPAALKVSAYPNQDFPAIISSIAPAADAASHTFPVTIVPLNEDGKLRPGMVANIAILLEEKTDVVLVPRSAITQVGGQDVVYVVSEDGKSVSLRPITLGLSDDGRIEVVSGLEPGETIVLSGLSNLSDGASIDIVAAAQ